MLLNHTTEFVSLCQEIRERLENKETYEQVADDYPERIKPGHIWKMVNKEWEPRKPEIRTALGLPAYVEIPTCPVPGCVEEYIHLHGSATYDPALSTVRPLRKPGKARMPRNYAGKLFVF